MFGSYSIPDETKGYVNADWGGRNLDRPSYSGFVLVLNWEAICWESHKQRCVSALYNDSKYIALSEATRELMYLCSFMIELGLNNMSRITFFLMIIPLPNQWLITPSIIIVASTSI